MCISISMPFMSILRHTPMPVWRERVDMVPSMTEDKMSGQREGTIKEEKTQT